MPHQPRQTNTTFLPVKLATMKTQCYTMIMRDFYKNAHSRQSFQHCTVVAEAQNKLGVETEEVHPYKEVSEIVFQRILDDVENA